MDIITYRHDDLLFPFKLTLKEFLLVYKDTHKLQTVPYPTVDEFTSSDRAIYDAVNNVQPNAPNPPPTNTSTMSTAIVVATSTTANPYNMQESSNAMDETKDDDDDGDNDPHDIVIGGRCFIARETFNAFVNTILDPLDEFHQRRITNDESKRIKSKLMPISLNSAAARIAVA